MTKFTEIMNWLKNGNCFLSNKEAKEVYQHIVTLESENNSLEARLEKAEEILRLHRIALQGYAELPQKPRGFPV